MTEGQRVKFIVDSLCGGNQSRFAKSTGIGKSVVNKIIKESGGPEGIRLTETYINRIINAFPEVNENWLRTGREEPGDISVQTLRVKYLSIIKELNRQIEELKYDNALLKKTIEKLL